jgi:Uma2 family endonuclease
MTAAVSDHVGPWSEEEFFALGETTNRIELIDGSLWVSAAPNKRHQTLSLDLAVALRSTAHDAGLMVFQAVNLRLKQNRIVIPDILVADTDEDGDAVEASEVRLVCEIVSPGNAAADRVVKMQLYALAAIPFYLLVEPGKFTRLFRLDGEHYVHVAAADWGVRLQASEPFPIDIAVGKPQPV